VFCEYAIMVKHVQPHKICYAWSLVAALLDQATQILLRYVTVLRFVTV